MPSEHISFDYNLCSHKSGFANSCGEIAVKNMMEHDCEKENGGVLSECSVRYCVLALTLQHF